MEWQIQNANLIKETSFEKRQNIRIKNGYIEEVCDFSQLEDAHNVSKLAIPSVNVHGMYILPAFINAHDNLLASYYTFQGTNHPYNNWLPWDNELKDSVLFRQRMLLDPSELYQMGSYRNILSGVAIVVDHVPEHVRKPFENAILPKTLHDFGISHSVCSYSLNWGQGIRKEYEYAVENNLAHIVHIAEGFDKESRSSLKNLEDLGALGENSVLVHGLSLSLNDLDRIAKAGASLVWCPVSNQHIYGKMSPIQEVLKRGIAICLGSDAAMYGSINLLDDIRYAQESYTQKYGVSLEHKTLFSMLHKNSEKAFRLPSYSDFSVGAPANLIILRNWESLEQITMEDIYLLVCDGEPIYGDKEWESLFISCGVLFERFSSKNTKRIIKKHSHPKMQNLDKILTILKKEKQLNFLPISIE